MIYFIEPVAKPRMTRKDQFRPAVQRYWSYKAQLKLLKVHVPVAGAEVHFFLSMPKSWPKKKKLAMAGKPHQQVPDLDNLLKGLLDAVYENDSKVYHLAGLSKSWAMDGCIVITLPRDEEVPNGD